MLASCGAGSRGLRARDDCIPADLNWRARGQGRITSSCCVMRNYKVAAESQADPTQGQTQLAKNAIFRAI
jgi:hypothetical protein